MKSRRAVAAIAALALIAVPEALAKAPTLLTVGSVDRHPTVIGTTVAASAYAAASPAAATPKELSLYLGAVHTKIAVHNKLDKSTIPIFNSTNEATVPARLKPILRKMRANATALAAVKTTAELRSLNGSLVKGLRIEITGNETLGNLIARGAEFDELVEKHGAVLDRAAALLVHWRDEMIAKLRSAGMTVPLWVKDIAKDLLPKE